MSFPAGHALYFDTRLNNLSWPQSHVRNSRGNTGLVLEAWNQFAVSYVSAILLAILPILRRSAPNAVRSALNGQQLDGFILAQKFAALFTQS